MPEDFLTSSHAQVGIVAPSNDIVFGWPTKEVCAVIGGGGGGGERRLPHAAAIEFRKECGNEVLDAETSRSIRSSSHDHIVPPPPPPPQSAAAAAAGGNHHQSMRRRMTDEEEGGREGGARKWKMQRYPREVFFAHTVVWWIRW